MITNYLFAKCRSQNARKCSHTNTHSLWPTLANSLTSSTRYDKIISAAKHIQRTNTYERTHTNARIFAHRNSKGIHMFNECKYICSASGAIVEPNIWKKWRVIGCIRLCCVRNVREPCDEQRKRAWVRIHLPTTEHIFLVYVSSRHTHAHEFAHVHYRVEVAHSHNAWWQRHYYRATPVASCGVIAVVVVVVVVGVR